MNPSIFDHLDTDPLEEVPASPARIPTQPARAAGHVEQCPKCRGSGGFYGYSGRRVGNCFTCGGTGKKTYAQPAAVRATQREARQTRQQARRDEAIADFCQRNPEVWSWLQANTRNEFAVSLMAGLTKYGSLTDGQVRAVQNAIAKANARAAARAAQPAAATTEIDASKIQRAFDKALEYGRNLGPRAQSRMASPRIQVGGIRFKLAGQNSRNPGAIYVLDTNHLGADGKPTYLGKIQGGQFTCSPVATPEEVAEVVRIAHDPEQAAIAHGRITGNCAICSRGLTRHDSIQRGIGPICAERMGW